MWYHDPYYSGEYMGTSSYPSEVFDFLRGSIIIDIKSLNDSSVPEGDDDIMFVAQKNGLQRNIRISSSEYLSFDFNDFKEVNSR